MHSRARKVSVVFLARGECRRAGVLQRRGRSHGQEIVDFSDGTRQVGGAITQPTRHPVTEKRLAHAVDQHGVLAHAGKRHHGYVPLAVVHDVLVDFVGDGERVELAAQTSMNSSSSRVKTLPVGLFGVLK